tara:strand:- start:3208 stop:3372 length:165 start_codon:yes stop_codon:yes gene_type:complete
MDDLDKHIKKIQKEIDIHLNNVQKDFDKNIKTIEKGWNDYVVKPIKPVFDPFLQ